MQSEHNKIAFHRIVTSWLQVTTKWQLEGLPFLLGKEASLVLPVEVNKSPGFYCTKRLQNIILSKVQDKNKKQVCNVKSTNIKWIQDLCNSLMRKQEGEASSKEDTAE